MSPFKWTWFEENRTIVLMIICVTRVSFLIRWLYPPAFWEESPSPRHPSYLRCVLWHLQWDRRGSVRPGWPWCKAEKIEDEYKKNSGGLPGQYLTPGHLVIDGLKDGLLPRPTVTNLPGNKMCKNVQNQVPDFGTFLGNNLSVVRMCAQNQVLSWGRIFGHLAASLHSSVSPRQEPRIFLPRLLPLLTWLEQMQKPKHIQMEVEIQI